MTVRQGSTVANMSVHDMCKLSKVCYFNVHFERSFLVSALVLLSVSWLVQFVEARCPHG